MGRQDDPLRDAICALAADTAETWEAFVRLASGPVWAACLRAVAPRSRAEALFSHLMARLYAERSRLPQRLVDSGPPDAGAFLDREVDRHLGDWVVDLFRSEAADAAGALVRLYHADIKAWVLRATPHDARGGVEDRVQDVYAGLFENGGRRIAAFAGSAPFRPFLRSTVVNLAADSARQDHGRRRPRAAFARLSPLERQAYRLLYEERLSAADAARRLAHPGAGAAIAKVLEMGDLGQTHLGDRPRLVALDDGEHPLDPVDERGNPEEILLAFEDMVARTEREDAVVAALRALPPEHRRILEARFLDGRKPRDIAASAGLDVKEVYRILERSLVHLKHVLGRPS